MAGSPRQRRVVVGVGLVILACTAVLARQGCGGADAALDDVRTELLEPYAAEVGAGHDEAAFAGHTTAAYRRRTDLLVFRTGQARNRDEHGRLVRLVPVPDTLQRVADPDGTVVTRLEVAWEGERSTARTVFDVVEDEEGWAIERTWAWAPGGLASERVY